MFENVNRFVGFAETADYLHPASRLVRHVHTSGIRLMATHLVPYWVAGGLRIYVLGDVRTGLSGHISVTNMFEILCCIIVLCMLRQVCEQCQ